MTSGADLLGALAAHLVDEVPLAMGERAAIVAAIRSFQADPTAAPLEARLGIQPEPPSRRRDAILAALAAAHGCSNRPAAAAARILKTLRRKGRTRYPVEDPARVEALVKELLEITGGRMIGRTQIYNILKYQ